MKWNCEYMVTVEIFKHCTELLQLDLEATSLFFAYKNVHHHFGSFISRWYLGVCVIIRWRWEGGWCLNKSVVSHCLFNDTHGWSGAVHVMEFDQTWDQIPVYQRHSQQTWRYDTVFQGCIAISYICNTYVRKNTHEGAFTSNILLQNGGSVRTPILWWHNCISEKTKASSKGINSGLNILTTLSNFKEFVMEFFYDTGFSISFCQFFLWTHCIKVVIEGNIHVSFCTII